MLSLRKIAGKTNIPSSPRDKSILKFWTTDRFPKKCLGGSKLTTSAKKNAKSNFDLAFFSEIRSLRNEWNTLTRVKLPAAVKYACGVWRNEFYFTSNRAEGGVRYFTISARKLFHIRRKPNISLEKRTGLWYNENRKAVLLWRIRSFVIYQPILR